MTIPRGVTVRQAGSERRHPTPDNMLSRASQEPDVDIARFELCAALGLPKQSTLARIHLSDADRWPKISPTSRLMEIANWLHAECYEAMDLVESPAISTIGD